MRRNEETWHALIYDLPFLREDGAEDPDRAAVWRHLDQLERDGRLTQVDIMTLRSILEHLHDLSFNEGFERGREDD